MVILYQLTAIHTLFAFYLCVGEEVLRAEFCNNAIVLVTEL